tara:strand:+ start:2006 stop:2923 length:918 start_codon:yes stop_codon:yes gene_type:complete
VGTGNRVGTGRGRGRSTQPQQQQLEDDSVTRYERISLLAAELQGGATGGDGADSVLFSDGCKESCDESAIEHHSDGDGDADSYEDHVNAEECDVEGVSALETSDDEIPPPKVDKKKRHTAEKRHLSTDEMMTSASFGGSRMFCGAESDEESQVSRTSSKRKHDAYRQAFPVKGVTCVGCSLANRIGPVERFVNANVGRQSEHALWKFASMTWNKEVVIPARNEGVHVVDWKWRDIANHFRLHTTSHTIGRTAMINTLTAMRCQVESVLVRNDNGQRTLDKANAELALKVCVYHTKPLNAVQIILW